VTPVLRTYRKYAIACSCRGCHRNATGCCKSNYRLPMLLIYEASIFISVLVTKIKRIIMSAIIEEFNDYRSKMNEKLLAEQQNSETIFNLDTNAYAAGALDVKQKNY
jgi:hypothetical protein